MRNIVENEYFDWLYNIVCDDESNIKYRSLLWYMFQIEFVWFVDKDANRASDGINLRYEFGRRNNYSRREIDEYLEYMPCSVLEMMIALAINMEDHIMCDPSIGDRTGQWFWNMIASLGLLGMSDGKFDMYYAGNKIDIFLERKYKRNGEGGLFTVKDRSLDMRDAEIWYQANWYLDENFDFTL